MMTSTLKKTTLTLLVLSSLIFSGCGDDESDKLTIDKDNITLHFEETEQLTASEIASWKSESEFVAKVDQNGLVKANHVGKTTVVASSPNGFAQCEVEVRPVYSTYIEPIIDFGKATRASVKMQESRDLFKDEGKILAFRGENPSIMFVMYMFDEYGKLETSAAMLPLVAATELTKFLLERYQPTAKDDDTYIFLNEKEDLYVVLSIVDTYLLVMYAPRTAVKSNQIDELLSNDMKSMSLELKNK